jgi:hypothetical protein
MFKKLIIFGLLLLISASACSASPEAQDSTDGVVTVYKAPN